MGGAVCGGEGLSMWGGRIGYVGGAGCPVCEGEGLGMWGGGIGYVGGGIGHVEGRDRVYEGGGAVCVCVWGGASFDRYGVHPCTAMFDVAGGVGVRLGALGTGPARGLRSGWVHLALAQHD